MAAPGSRFKDHFSRHSEIYATYRPPYPLELFDYLASLVTTRELAWDCATGNGQAALGLASSFRSVVASDASRSQILHAVPHERIHYVVSRAEENPLRARTMNLITVAQALHWFDFQKFYQEVRRVAAPGGILAAWSYGRMECSSSIDAILRKYHDEILGTYWPPERRYADENYRTIPFPFQKFAAPSFAIKMIWARHELFGYLESWSATQTYIKQNETNPIEMIRKEIERLWTDPSEKRQIRWPLNLCIGKI